MYIKLRIPLPIIIRKYRVKDLVISLGATISDRDLVIELSRSDTNKCNAAQEICSILGDLGGYNVRASIIGNSYEISRAARILSYIAKDIVLNNTLNISRALADVKLDKDDGILLCLISNGGIVFSIVRDPLNPVCFRIPSNNYYLVELHGLCPESQSDEITDLLNWVELLWNERYKEVPHTETIDLKPILSWKVQDKCYVITKGKPEISSANVFSISNWGLYIDIKH